MKRLLKALLPASQRPRVAGAVRAALYFGRSVACPCCGGRFRSFMPHRGRLAARCPRCGSLERNRTLWLYLEQDHQLPKPGTRILHIAPEYGLQRRLRALEGVEYLSADLDSPLATVSLDITSIPYPDSSFDLVLCSHVLEHVGEDGRAIAELHRVLAPGGRAILQLPVDLARERTLEDQTGGSPDERGRELGQSDHVRIYGRDVKRRLGGPGFAVEVVDHVSELSQEAVRRHGLRRQGRSHLDEVYEDLNDDRLYVCSKRVAPASSAHHAASDDQRLLIVSPVRDEGAHIERVARAVALQTRPPDVWVVVDDDSEDDTLAILRSLGREIPFMEVVAGAAGNAAGNADRLAAGAAPRAFMRGARIAGWSHFTHVGKLDGDTELPPDYFERLLRRFEEEPRLGIAGGARIERGRRGWRELRTPRHNVPGALKLYSRECFDAIGGVREQLAWDAIDETYAQMNGFTTRSFPELRAVHHRPLASRRGILRGRARYGEAFYIAHYSWLWILLRSFMVAAMRPFGLSAAAFVYGYVRAAAGPIQRVDDPEFRKHKRRELRERLRRPLRMEVSQP